MISASAGLARALLEPSRYDYPVDAVELIETHISWVLLAGAYAYKIKKPVNLGFLDFSTLEQRRFYCDEELRLNRRLAPNLYLELVPIGGTPDNPKLYGTPAIEYAVKMARFPQQSLLDRMLARGELMPQQIEDVARAVANFHRAIAGLPVPRGLGTAESVLQPVRANFAHLEQGLAGRGEGALLTVRIWSETEFARRHEDFQSRLQHGFVRECHGDLHLGNMALIDGRATLFDCIEFNPALRWIDVMNDTAFVIMDLEDRGRPDLARRFLDVYLQQGGDFAGLRVLRYYLVYRAMVRAKVACIRASQTDLAAKAADTAWRESATYLALAERFTRSIRPWLLITHGYSGSGKTHATQVLLERCGAIRLRSDVERKRLFGLAPEARGNSAVNSGLYAPDASLKTYCRLEELAREVLLAGFPVIVDAAFLKRAEREAFRALAGASGVPFRILELRAEEDVLRRRIVERAQAGMDASEATLEVLENQLRHVEAIAPEERGWTLTLNYGPDQEAALECLARGLMDPLQGFCQD